jgi:hypothetical protein
LPWCKGNLSLILGQYTRVFQAKVYAIKACAVENLDRNYRTGTHTFYQTVKRQLKHLENTRSPQNCSETATNPSYNWPNMTEFNRYGCQIMRVLLVMRGQI